MARFLLHWLGLDSASGPVYLAWSGAVGVLERLIELAVIAFILLYHHNCHVHRCWRIGRYHAAGGAYMVCARHNPDGKPDHARILAAHRRHIAAPGPGERLYDSRKDTP